MWWLIICVYFVFGATSYLLRRLLAQQLAERVRLMNSVFFVCFLLPVGLVYSIFVPHNLAVGWMNVAFLLLGSLIWPVMNLVAFTANKHVDVGVFTVINNISPVFTISVALALLGESLTPIQFVGIVLLISSGIIATLAQVKNGDRSGLVGIGLSLLAATLLGIGVAFERFMLTRIDFGAYIIYGWGAQIFWAAVMARKELHLIPSLFAKDSPVRKPLFFWGSTNALKSVAFISALKLGTASVVSATANFLSVIVVIAAFIFLKERNNSVYKLLAVAIGITGLFLLTG